MSGNWNDVLCRIKEELSGLAVFIDRTRQGIDNLENTVRVGSEKFPEASNQLTAVTGDLENAANNIMTILEGLMEGQERAGSLLKTLSSATASGAASAAVAELEEINSRTKKEMMDIFANMSFQDLTGQKLKKVIGSLAIVESKLLEMALSFGIDEQAARPGSNGVRRAASEVPVNQDIVDRLLKELGARG